MAAEIPAPPDASSLIVNNYGGLLAELSNEKKVAALKTRFSKDEDRYLWIFNVSGPIDDGATTSIVGDLDGLAPSASAEVGYQWIEFGRRSRITLSAKAGTKAFKFADPTNVASDSKERKESYEASLGWSRFLDNLVIFQNGALIGFRARYQESYKAADDVQICSPIEGTSSTTCRTTGSKAPTRLKPVILQAQLATLPIKNVGLALMVSRDIENDVTGVELPVYLVRDEKTGLLNGGIKLSWQSDTKDTSAILFIGMALGAF